MNRRQLLRVGGASALVLGAAGVGGYMALRGPGTGPATAPWQQAGGSFGDARLDALAYAILAPNPHNKQPWRFTLEGEDKVVVHCDLGKRLPATDPHDRQITIGFGAMIALFQMAAEANGHIVTVDPFPEGSDVGTLDERPIARLALGNGGGQADPLFANVLNRHTNRAPFEDRAVDADDVAKIVDAGRREDPNSSEPGSILTPGDVAAVTAIADEGWRIEHGTPATLKESADVTRIGNRAVTENPDGIALQGAFFELLKRAGVLTQESMVTEGTTAWTTARDGYLQLINSARGFLTLTAAENTRFGQLVTGEQWLRMHLKATSLGIAYHPLSQVLQEFEEMAGPYAAIHERLRPGGIVHMLVRIGYAPAPDPAPRWPLTAKLEGA
ncbi:MAG: twin-arginine translocation pathway signal protein [Pseudomonadota bacterium]